MAQLPSTGLENPSVSNIGNVNQPVGNEQPSNENDNALSASPSIPELGRETSQDLGDSSALRKPRHTETSSIYIWNLTRPLITQELKSYIIEVAQEEPTLVWLDRIRSHCFATFPTIAGARRACEALNDQVFPPEDRSRKPMKVDYVPTEKVADWISIEESDGPRSARRWKVRYVELVGGAQTELVEIGGEKPEQRPSQERPRSSKLDAEATLREATLRLKLQSSMLKNRVDKHAPASSRFKHTKARPLLVYSEAPRDVIEERLKRKM